MTDFDFTYDNSHPAQRTPQQIVDDTINYANSLMNTCKKCGYTWQPRNNKPSSMCPRCKTLHWDTDTNIENLSTTTKVPVTHVPFNKLTANILESILIVFLVEETLPNNTTPLDTQAARTLATQLTNAIVTNLTQS